MERERSRALRLKLKELRAMIAMLASVNEVLTVENHILKARQAATNVVGMVAKEPKNG